MAPHDRPLNINEVTDLLYKSVREDDEKSLRNVLATFSYMIDNRLAREAVSLSIRSGSAKALKTILSWRTGVLTESYTADLFNDAITGKNKAVWDMVYSGYKATGSRKVKLTDLFLQAVRAGWPEVSDELCRELAVSPTSLSQYGEMVVASARRSGSELQGLLAYVDYFSGDRIYLERALIAAAESWLMDNVDLLAKKGAVPCPCTPLDNLLKKKIAERDSDAAIRLLSYGADPNADQGEAMCIAIATNNPDMLDALIEAGGNVEKHCEAISSRLAREYPGAQLFSSVQVLAGKAYSERLVREEENNYTLANPYTLAYAMKLQDSMVLTTLFNFKLRQQVSVIRDAENHQLSMDVKSFDDVLGDQEIANLREKLEARGGTAESFGGDKKRRPPPALGKALSGK